MTSSIIHHLILTALLILLILAAIVVAYLLFLLLLCFLRFWGGSVIFLWGVGFLNYVHFVANLLINLKF